MPKTDRPDPLTDPIDLTQEPATMTATTLDLAVRPELVANEPTPTEPPIPAAFDYAADRLDRLERALDNLHGVVMRAGSQLEPLLTDGTYDDPAPMAAPEDPSAKRDDRRSTIARRVTVLGDRAQQLGDATDLVARRLEAILDRVEL